MGKKEIWGDINGYYGKYQISTRGNVKSINFNQTNEEKILKPRITKGDYRQVVLYKNGQGKPFYVHVLVAKTFLPNPLNLPEVNHKNGDKTDNSIDNLEWVSARKNSQHAVIHKLRIYPTYKILQFDKFNVFIREWDCVTDIINTIGGHSSMIYKCCEGKIDFAYGFIWRYGTRNSDNKIYVGGDSYQQLS